MAAGFKVFEPNWLFEICCNRHLKDTVAHKCQRPEKPQQNNCCVVKITGLFQMVGPATGKADRSSSAARGRGLWTTLIFFVADPAQTTEDGAVTNGGLTMMPMMPWHGAPR